MTEPKPLPARLASLRTAKEYADGKAGGVASIRTFRRWVATGVLPGYRMGPTRLLIDLDDIDALIVPSVPLGTTPQDAV